MTGQRPGREVSVPEHGPPVASLIVVLPGGRLDAVPLDDWTLRHVALALNAHHRAARLSGTPTPIGLGELARRTTQHVTARHGATDPEADREPVHDAAMNPPPTTLTLGQTADALQVSLRTVQRRIKDGDLRCVRVGDRRRVLPADLDAYLDPDEPAA